MKGKARPGMYSFWAKWKMRSPVRAKLGFVSLFRA